MYNLKADGFNMLVNKRHPLFFLICPHIRYFENFLKLL